jgi:hypothetical protein
MTGLRPPCSAGTTSSMRDMAALVSSILRGGTRCRFWSTCSLKLNSPKIPNLALVFFFCSSLTVEIHAVLFQCMGCYDGPACRSQMPCLSTGRCTMPPVKRCSSSRLLSP